MYRPTTTGTVTWRASIVYGGRMHDLGEYDTERKAARAFDAAARRRPAGSVELNFPDDGVDGGGAGAGATLPRVMLPNGVGNRGKCPFPGCNGLGSVVGCQEHFALSGCPSMRRLRKKEENADERRCVMAVWAENGLEGVPFDIDSFRLLLQ